MTESAAARAVSQIREARTVTPPAAPEPLVVAHMVSGPKLYVDIRTPDGRITERVYRYLVQALELHVSTTIEDNEKPGLLAALADAELEPAALHKGIR